MKIILAVLWEGVQMTRTYVTPNRGINTSKALAAFLQLVYTMHRVQYVLTRSGLAFIFDTLHIDSLTSMLT